MAAAEDLVVSGALVPARNATQLPSLAVTAVYRLLLGHSLSARAIFAVRSGCVRKPCGPAMKSLVRAELSPPFLNTLRQVATRVNGRNTTAINYVDLTRAVAAHVQSSWSALRSLLGPVR